MLQHQIDNIRVDSLGVEVSRCKRRQAQLPNIIILSVRDIRQAQQKVGGHVKFSHQGSQHLITEFLYLTILQPAEGGCTDAHPFRQFFFCQALLLPQFCKPLAYLSW